MAAGKLTRRQREVAVRDAVAEMLPRLETPGSKVVITLREPTADNQALFSVELQPVFVCRR